DFQYCVPGSRLCSTTQTHWQNEPVVTHVCAHREIDGKARGVYRGDQIAGWRLDGHLNGGNIDVKNDGAFNISFIEREWNSNRGARTDEPAGIDYQTGVAHSCQDLLEVFGRQKVVINTRRQ